MSLLINQVIETAGRLALAAAEKAPEKDLPVPGDNAAAPAAAPADKAAGQSVAAAAAPPATSPSAETASTGASEHHWYQAVRWATCSTADCSCGRSC